MRSEKEIREQAIESYEYIGRAWALSEEPKTDDFVKGWIAHAKWVLEDSEK